MDETNLQEIISRIKVASKVAMQHENYSLGQVLGNAAVSLMDWSQEGLSGDPPIDIAEMVRLAENPEIPYGSAPEIEGVIDEPVDETSTSLPPKPLIDCTPEEKYDFFIQLKSLLDLKYRREQEVYQVEVAPEDIKINDEDVLEISIIDHGESLEADAEQVLQQGYHEKAVEKFEEARAVYATLGKEGKPHQKRVNNRIDKILFQSMPDVEINEESQYRKKIDSKTVPVPPPQRLPMKQHVTNPGSVQKEQILLPASTSERVNLVPEIGSLLKSAEGHIKEGEENQALARLYEAREKVAQSGEQPVLAIAIQLALDSLISWSNEKQESQAKASTPQVDISPLISHLQKLEKRIEGINTELGKSTKLLESVKSKPGLSDEVRKLLQQPRGIKPIWTFILCSIFFIIGGLSGAFIFNSYPGLLNSNLNENADTPAASVALAQETPTETIMPTPTSTPVILPVKAVFPQQDDRTFPIIPWQIVLDSEIEFPEPPSLWLNPVNLKAVEKVQLSLTDQSTSDFVSKSGEFPLLLPWIPQVEQSPDDQGKTRYTWTRSSSDLVELPNGTYEILVNSSEFPGEYTKLAEIVIDNTMEATLALNDKPIYNFSLYRVPIPYPAMNDPELVINRYDTSVSIRIYGKIIFTSDLAEGVEEKVDGVFRNSLCFLSVSPVNQLPEWGWAYCYQVMNPNDTSGAFDLPLLSQSQLIVNE